MARLVLNHQHLAQLREQRGGLESDQDLAHAIGVHPTQVSRVLRGFNQPGAKFIAGVLDLFGKDTFGDLFDVVPDDNGDAAA